MTAVRLGKKYKRKTFRSFRSLKRAYKKRYPGSELRKFKTCSNTIMALIYRIPSYTGSMIIDGKLKTKMDIAKKICEDSWVI
jgi:hypothetical protein